MTNTTKRMAKLLTYQGHGQSFNSLKTANSRWIYARGPTQSTGNLGGSVADATHVHIYGGVEA